MIWEQALKMAKSGFINFHFSGAIYFYFSLGSDP